jgi:hypothetical protein
MGKMLVNRRVRVGTNRRSRQPLLSDCGAFAPTRFASGSSGRGEVVLAEIRPTPRSTGLPVTQLLEVNPRRVVGARSVEPHSYLKRHDLLIGDRNIEASFRHCHRQAQPRAARGLTFDLGFFRRRLFDCSGLLGRLPPSALLRERFTRRRSALFTDAESGNASRRSGSKKTTLVPPLNASWCLPRTPPEKSYSGRMSSASGRRVCGFIALAFLRGCLSRIDYSNTTIPLSVRHDKQASGGRPADTEKPLLTNGMVRIRNRHFERIAKDSDCLGEFDMMFRRVLSRFGGIPLELHGPSLLILRAL